MIICSCNAITETDIRKAARLGAACPRAAYERLGFEPDCEGCFDHASEIIEEELSNIAASSVRAAA